MAIVTSTYRYKRPPKKRKPNPAALVMPRIVTAKTPKPGRVSKRFDTSDQAKAGPDAANDDQAEHLPSAGKRSTIVTIRNRKRAALTPLPDMTEEEHKRRGDAADALFRDMKRRIAEKLW